MQLTCFLQNVTLCVVSLFAISSAEAKDTAVTDCKWHHNGAPTSSTLMLDMAELTDVSGTCFFLGYLGTPDGPRLLGRVLLSGEINVGELWGNISGAGTSGFCHADPAFKPKPNADPSEVEVEIDCEVEFRDGSWQARRASPEHSVCEVTCLWIGTPKDAAPSQSN